MSDVVEILAPSNTLQQVEAAALDVQVATAKQYPRSVQRFESDLRTWSRMNKYVAESCFYALKRGSNKIIGPSVRFAELVLAAYQNVICDAKVISEEGGFVICDAVCRDLERNIALRAQVRRRIVDKNGSRYSEHVIESTVMAGLAIARRNAIFSVIPRALWEPIWEEAKKTASGDASDFATTRKQIVQALADAEIPESNWLAYVGRESVKDLKADDCLALRLALSQIEKGENDRDELFPDPNTKPKRHEDAESAIREAARQQRSAKAHVEAAAEAPEEPEVGPDPEDPEQAEVDAGFMADAGESVPQVSEDELCGQQFEGPDGPYPCTRGMGHDGRCAWDDPEGNLESVQAPARRRTR